MGTRLFYCDDTTDTRHPGLHWLVRYGSSSYRPDVAAQTMLQLVILLLVKGIAHPSRLCTAGNGKR